MHTIAIVHPHVPVGRIVNVSSAFSYLPGIQSTVYCNSKLAMNQFSRLLNMELSQPFGIKTINVVVGNYAAQTDIMPADRQRQIECQWSEMDHTKQLYYADLYHRLRSTSQLNSAELTRQLSNDIDQLDSLWDKFRYWLFSQALSMTEAQGFPLSETNITSYFHDAVYWRDCPSQIYPIHGPLRVFGPLMPYIPNCYLNLIQPWSHTKNKNKPPTTMNNINSANNSKLLL